MIVLDTNVVSELLRPRPEPRVVDWVRGQGDDLVLSSITAAELLAGVAALPEGRRRPRLGRHVVAVLEDYDSRGSILPFDLSAAEVYADVLTRRSRAGRPVSTPDAQIAAICRARGASLATRSVRDLEGTGVLRIIDPWS